MSRRLTSTQPSLLGELKLCTEVGPSLGDFRIQLLEAIEKTRFIITGRKSRSPCHTVPPGMHWMK